MMKILEDCPYHFNLIQINPVRGKWEWGAQKLIARSDNFPFKGAAKVGEPQSLPEDQLKSRRAQLLQSTTTSKLSRTEKIVIGVVPFISLCVLVGGLWRFWWLPRKRNKLGKETEKSDAGIPPDLDGSENIPPELDGSENVPPELDGSQNIERYEMGDNEKRYEGDYDTYIRELEDYKPAASELDAANVPVAELEGSPRTDWKDFKDVPKIIVDSPR
jgi:hypothetical protein